MMTLGARKARRLLFLALSVLLLTCFSCVSALAATRVNIEEGTYYIKAINGNAKGKVLYWDENASDQNTSMMFESCGGSHADNEVWFITRNRSFNDYYGIYLAKDYSGNKDKSKRIEIDNLTGRDKPYIPFMDDLYIFSTKGPHVFCGAFSNQDDGFYFVCEKGDDYSTNLTIRSRENNYTFNRHKEVKIFHHDLIYVNANKDNDTNNKLWELVPVNYERNMSQNSLSLTAQNSGRVNIDWEKFRDRIKNSEVWKNAKYIEIQYGTDKDFIKNTKIKTVEKGTVNKSKAKTALSKLDKNTIYYVRARLVDGDGVNSNWSKSIKIKTKGGKWQILPNGQANKITMTVGDSLDLKAALSLEDDELTWKSRDADIAAVSEEGIATALKAGTAHISVTNEDGDEALITVRVKDAEGVELLDGVDDLILPADELQNEAIGLLDGTDDLILPTDEAQSEATGLLDGADDLILPTDEAQNEAIELSMD